MLPLTIKQYQGTAKMQKLNPRLEELRRQYGTDKKRLQEETMKLYQEEKVNPAGGCLPLLIQFPILFSLYPVITRPLRYMLGKTVEQVSAIQELFNTITGNTRSFVQEMEIINFFKNTPSAMSQAESANLLVPTDLINMNFVGLDLSRTPTYSPNLLFGEQMAIYLPLLLIPIIGVVSTYISGKISMASSAAQSSQNQQASSMGKSMQIFGPVMTLIFSFQLPAGVLVYWIAGYLIQIVQQLFINKYVLKLNNIFTGKGGEANDGKGPARLPDKGGGPAGGASASASVSASAGAIAGTVAGSIKSLPGNGGTAGGAGSVGGTGAGTNAGPGTGSGAGKGRGADGGRRYTEGVGASSSTVAGTVVDGNYNMAGGAGANFSGSSNGSIAAGRSLTDGMQKQDDEELYDGGAMINRVISSLDIAGATGGGAVKAAGTDGIVHGGVFETKIRIPGITSTDGYADGDVIDSANIYIDENPNMPAPEYDRGLNATFESNSGVSNFGGYGAGGSSGVSSIGGGGIGSNGSGDNAANEPGQRSRGIDTRSSTRKNYGSQKRKKKK